MEAISENAYVKYFSRALYNVATNPENIRLVTRAMSFGAKLLNNMKVSEALSMSDSVIGTLASARVFEDIRTFKYAEKGISGAVYLGIDFVDFCFRGVFLASKFELISLGKAANPLDLTTTGLSIVQRTISIYKNVRKLWEYSNLSETHSSSLSHMQRKALNPKREIKRIVWENRVKRHKLKKIEAYLNVAFLTSLIALHSLSAARILAPTVPYATAFILVVATITLLGLTKLALSAAIPEEDKRKYSKLSEHEKAFSWERGLYSPQLSK